MLSYLRIVGWRQNKCGVFCSGCGGQRKGKFTPGIGTNLEGLIPVQQSWDTSMILEEIFSSKTGAVVQHLAG